MKSIRICIIILLTAFCGSAFAGEIMDFELTDGTVIHGRLVSYSDGVYTIKSKSLGTVKIGEDKVRATHRSGGSSTGAEAGQAPQAGGATSGEVQGLATKMMGDEQIMALIQELQNDPEMQALLNDPSVMSAISSGNLSALTSNPKFMQLLNNPKVREIQKRMGQ